MPIKAIFLDLGNVICPIDIERGVSAICAHTGAKEALVRQTLFGDMHGYSEIFAQFERGEITSTQFFHLFARALGCAEWLTFHEFAELWGSVFLPENVGLASLLSRITVQKFLISNINELAYSRFAAECTIVKQHIPLPCNRILSCRVGALKPDPEIYLHALAQANIAAHEGLLIDDLPQNIDGWRMLGGHGIVYNAHTHSLDELEAALTAYRVFA